jgi:hypothetical protein
LGSLVPAGMERASARDFHAALIEDTKAGRWTVIDFWDSLPWLRGDVASWLPWRACAAAVFGLPMSPAELAIYQKCTKRQRPPTQQVDEAWLPVGRRGKKSAWSAVIASFVGAYWDHSSYTAPGEYARIPILAKDKDEAKAIKGYIDAIFENPALSWMVEDSSVETTTLSTRCEIQVKAATITAGRSRAVPLWILDEVAFFRTGDAAHPDTEILRGLRPAQATVPHPLGIAASSPYARKGELYNTYKENFGKEDSRILVWQADTLTMHPGNPQVLEHVTKEYAKDPVSAAAEYGAKFRLDVETFITDEIVDAVTDVGVPERQPVKGIQYVAFVDPSGGTSDSMTLGIAHWESESHIVLDLLREERPTEEGPFQPSKVTERMCHVLARYGVRDVEGDRYAGEWPREAFDKGFCDHEDEHKLNAFGLCEFRYSVAYNVAESPKRAIYRDVLPLLTDRDARLIDHARLKAQLVDLERRPSSMGDIIDHPPGGKDDVANAAAGALVRADRLKLRPRVVQDPPKNLVEAHVRKLHNTLKERMKQKQRGEDGVGNGGFL